MINRTVAETGWATTADLTARSRPLVMTVACGAALIFGLLVPVAPWSAVGALAVIALVAVPDAALLTVVAVTVLVPFQTQDMFSIIGGRGHPSMLLVDAILAAGLLRLGWLALRRRLTIDLPLLTAATLAAICTAAVLWGMRGGATVSGAGHEARRVLLAPGVFMLAWPLMASRSAHRHLIWGLVGIGVVLGVWGLTQWFLPVGYTVQGDVGVRPGINVTGAGPGQLQGGMFAFPVAVILAWAGLLMHRDRSAAVTSALAAVLVLNAVCLLLTFERTLWLAAAAGCAFVVITSGAVAARLAMWWASLGAAALIVAALMSPAEAHTAFERLGSVAAVSTDNSFTARLVESRAVLQTVSAHPLLGSGFGSTITWGARDMFATVTTPFTHDGYLWLAWKVGIPVAAFTVLLLGRAVFRSARTSETPEWHALRTGARASLVALFVIAVTFPVFDVLGITATIGLLAAISYSGADPPSEAVSK